MIAVNLEDPQFSMENWGFFLLSSKKLPLYMDNRNHY